MISAECYVSLVTTESLDKAGVQAWYQCVKATLPSGLLCTVQTHGPDGSLRPVSLIVRKSEGKSSYIIPLTRSLTEGEGIAVTEAYGTLDDGDYEIAASSSYQSLVPDADVVVVDDAKYAQLCADWAKRQHDEWMRSRLAAGWRYGEVMSMGNRTHPMLKPWNELPDEQRGIDVEAPAMMVQLLNDEGYAIIDKSELEAIRALLRQQAER